MSASVGPGLDHHTVYVYNFLETEKDILRVISIERLIAAFADDLFGEGIHPKITNVIVGIGKASQIKSIGLHVPRMPSRISRARCLDPASRDVH